MFRCDLLAVDPASGYRQRIRISGSEDDPVEMLTQLVEGVLPGVGPLFVDDRQLPDRGTLGAIGLLDGATLSCGEPRSGLRDRSVAPLELRVVGGVGVGQSYPLSPGPHLIGRGSVEVNLGDIDVSRRHAQLTVGIDGSLSVVDLKSRNGTVVEGRPVQEPTSVQPGDRIEIGAVTLEVVSPEVERLQVEPRGAQLGVHRRFRSAETAWPTEVAFPQAGRQEDPPALNLLLTIAPGVAMGAIAVFTGRLEFLLFAAMAPVLGLGRVYVQRRDFRRRTARDSSELSAAQCAAQESLDAALRQERLARRAGAGDLATLAVDARLPGRHLWERAPADGDFLDLRIGDAAMMSMVAVKGTADEQPRQLWSMPALVNLVMSANLSLVGPVGQSRRLAAGLILQLAVRHSPADVKIVVIGGTSPAETWAWVAWLPHTRWSLDDDYALVGSDLRSTEARFLELRTLLKVRQERGMQDRNAPATWPSVVVIVDGVSGALPLGLGELMRDGPGAKIHCICLDAAQVPEHCRASVALGEESLRAAKLDRAGEQPIEDLLVDQPNPWWCEVVARTLAPLRPIGGVGTADLPSALRLLDLLALPAITADTVIDRWQSGPTPKATVGVARDGVVAIDLTRDGPHGLVAGTTRSGKSEFLKSLVAAFALANHPDDLSFLFIDFKASGDFEIAKRLPHAIDLATVKDIEDFQRTLRLLEAEIDRRRRLFTAAETSTIEGYVTARRQRVELPPVGRMVVVADEFGQLAMRANDQLEKLVTVAQTGAAFGIHLLLATQRPAGAVTGQIDANVALRVCFRVERPDDSDSVLGTKDAVSISERHRGRGYRYSPNQPLGEFQSARVAGARRDRGPSACLFQSR